MIVMLDAIFRGASHSGGPSLQAVPAALERPEGTRRYLVAAPAACVTDKRPLVIVLHGGKASAAQVMGQAFPPSPLSVWLEIAAREHLVVIAPDAGKGDWNDGMVSRKSAAGRDDVAFIGALIDYAIAAHSVDRDRVYVIGVSHGGFMAYRLALEMPHRLAAFSALLAGMPHFPQLALRPRPLPVLIVGCSADPLVRYSGGRHWYAPPFMQPMHGIEQTAAFWRALAGLPDTPEVSPLPKLHAWDTTAATRVLWGNDPRGLQVALYRIDGAGHAEPSALKRYPRFINWLTGRQNADIEIAEAAWDFFRDKRCTDCAAGSPALHVEEVH